MTKEKRWTGNTVLKEFWPLSFCFPHRTLSVAFLSPSYQSMWYFLCFFCQSNTVTTKGKDRKLPQVHVPSLILVSSAISHLINSSPWSMPASHPSSYLPISICPLLISLSATLPSKGQTSKVPHSDPFQCTCCFAHACKTKYLGMHVHIF